MAKPQVFNDRLTVTLPHKIALKLHIFSHFKGEQKLAIVNRALSEYLDRHWDDTLAQLEALWIQKESSHE